MTFTVDFLDFLRAFELIFLHSNIYHCKQKNFSLVNSITVPRIQHSSIGKIPREHKYFKYKEFFFHFLIHI